MKRKQKNQQDLSQEKTGDLKRDRRWQKFFGLANEIRVPDFLVERGDRPPQEFELFRTGKVNAQLRSPRKPGIAAYLAQESVNRRDRDSIRNPERKSSPDQ